MSNALPSLLITGVSGYLGRELSGYLTNLGYEVVGSYRNRDKPSLVPSVHIDLSQVSSRKIQIGAQLSALVHLAGLAHDLGNSKTDADYFLHNTQATVNAVHLAFNNGIKRFIFVSTLSVYDTSKWNCSIDCFTLPNPSTPYGRSKLQAEKEAYQLCSELGMDYICIRPSMILGHQAPGNIKRLQKLIGFVAAFPVPWPDNGRNFLKVEHFCGLVHLILSRATNENEGLTAEVLSRKSTVKTVEQISYPNTFVAASDPALSTRELIDQIATRTGLRVLCISVPVVFLRLFASIPKFGQSFVKLWGNLRVVSDTTKARFNWNNRD